ncbi:cytochrome P450 [Trifolium medium]|uniref:Cytochrome P450 n=1 Tax=Trifolium medium TaxID=97028 RepID=A0A392N6N3_9FABA|nr:cytochrome P450 [Trifolium medium]
MMQAEPATASGLIRAGILQNVTAAEPGATQTYSAAVNWKSTTPGRFKCNIDASFASHLNRVGIVTCIRDALGQFVLSKTEWIIALLCGVDAREPLGEYMFPN